jgi:polyisoprenoid-binding protein YceI
MSSDLNRREVLQGAAAASVSGVLGAKGSAMAPALFVSHGSPRVALETDAYPQALKALGEGLGPVRAVVVVSAHGETLNAVHVTAAEAPPLIHDFGGFPAPLYQLKYPSPGAPELARTIAGRLEAAGLKAVADPARGLDHTRFPGHTVLDECTARPARASKRRAPASALLRSRCGPPRGSAHPRVRGLPLRNPVHAQLRAAWMKPGSHAVPHLERNTMKLSLKPVVAALVLAAPMVAFGAEFEIDSAHSSAQFAVKHMMVSTVRGAFSNVTGKINIDEKDMTRSTVEAVIDAATINTNVAKRDEHLRSADFFDTAKYPTITFKSTKVEKAGENLKVTGDLTMHGVTKPVTLTAEGFTTEAKDPYGNIKRGGVATTKVNRKDFGLNYNSVLETGGVAVGEEVSITLDLQMNKKKEAAPAAAAPAAPATKAAPAKGTK